MISFSFRRCQMLTRRRFIHLTGPAILAPSTLSSKTIMTKPLPKPQNKSKKQEVQMYVGTQQGCTPDMLQFYKRYGVDHVCGTPEKWTREGLLELKERCISNGIALDMVPIGMPRSVGLLGDKAYRDMQIEQTCEQIRIASKADIPAIKYNMTVLDVLRTGTTPGRGGSRYSTWEYERAAANKSLTRGGKYPADLFWERISCFLERVIPVAAEYRIKMACHPHDPGVPSEGYRGVKRVLGNVEGLKRFIEIIRSPYHGLNFCVGTIGSNMNNPSEEIFDVIRYFGKRNKIFNIHFRNIRGKRNHFQEVYPDEGDLDMVRILHTLKEVGYSGMVMPDHVPTHTNDPGGRQGLAFAFGYIKGLIQAVHTEI
jgi:mannonate dehydratase